MHMLVTVDAGAGANAAETAELAERLRDELGAHEYDSMPVEAAAPEGAKGLGVDVGSLLVALAASGGVLTSLIGTLQSWLGRQSGSRLVVEIDGDRIELTGASDEDRQRALDVWLARHDPDASTGGGNGGGAS